ncbi:hypothetical protein HMPREF9120_00356 [Neisseria sp. oral taxon 020 str. F0370]|nr:hypothetical protein HMPREF9120_00356 [Neisseria sp. oral taxon 020 str. F0370]
MCAAACAARVAHGGGGVQRVAGGEQQAAFVFVAGGGDGHVGNAAQEAEVVGAGVGGAVGADDAGAVDGKEHGQVLQGDVVHELVVAALQKGGVDGDDGFDAFAGEAGGEGDGVLFGDADVEIAFGKASGKFDEAAAFAHGGGDGGEAGIGFGLVAQPAAEDFGVGGTRGGRGGGGFGGGWGFADGVVFDGVVFGEFVALAFFGDDVQELRAFSAPQLGQGFDEFADVVAVDGAGVGEAEVFKQGEGLFDVFALARQRFDGFFGFLRDFFDGGEFAEHFVGAGFDGAEQAVHVAHDVAGEVFGQGADVGRDGHFVVVEDDEQVGVGHVARAVEGFEGLSGGHCAVADNGDAAGAAPGEFVGHGHAQCGADGGGGVTDAEVVVFAFAAFGETGEAAELAHGVHAVFAAGENFVGIALVADVPNQMVVRRVVNVMQGDGEFDRAEVAGEVAAGFADGFEQEGADFAAQLRQLGGGEQAQVLRQGDVVQ